jgi:hypothetical protein
VHAYLRLVIAKLACPSSVCERIQKSLFREKAKTKTTAGKKKITHVYARGFLPENHQAVVFYFIPCQQG